MALKSSFSRVTTTIWVGAVVMDRISSNKTGAPALSHMNAFLQAPTSVRRDALALIRHTCKYTGANVGFGTLYWVKRCFFGARSDTSFERSMSLSTKRSPEIEEPKGDVRATTDFRLRARLWRLRRSDVGISGQR